MQPLSVEQVEVAFFSQRGFSVVALPFSLPDVQIIDIISDESRLLISTQSRYPSAICPACHRASSGDTQRFRCPMQSILGKSVLLAQRRKRVFPLLFPRFGGGASLLPRRVSPHLAQAHLAEGEHRVVELPTCFQMRAGGQPDPREMERKRLYRA